VLNTGARHAPIPARATRPYRILYESEGNRMRACRVPHHTHTEFCLHKNLIEGPCVIGLSWHSFGCMHAKVCQETPGPRSNLQYVTPSVIKITRRMRHIFSEAFQMWALFGQRCTRQQSIRHAQHSTPQYTSGRYHNIPHTTTYSSVACRADGQDRQWVSTWSLANESGDAHGESCVTYTKDTMCDIYERNPCVIYTSHMLHTRKKPHTQERHSKKTVQRMSHSTHMNESSDTYTRDRRANGHAITDRGHVNIVNL